MQETNDRGQAAGGGPGIEPKWTGSAKDAIGTAYSAASTLWFTLSLGILNEVYYPTIDQPQIRDLQFVITDGKSFVHDERKHMQTEIEMLDCHAMGYRVTNSDPEGRYKIIKEIIADPHQPCLLVHTWLEPWEDLRGKLRLFALLAPHLEVGGWHNNGEVATVGERKLLLAYKGDTWLALGANVPFLKCSCGYVGVNDGWQDLFAHKDLQEQFDRVEDGNIALTGEIDLSHRLEFTLGLAFGDTRQRAVATLFQSLGLPFSQLRKRFIDQWERDTHRNVQPLDKQSGDKSFLFHKSHSLLLAHEDKIYAGALIASLSIPWGDTRGDEDLGGYHLVWVRDLVKSASALLATGNKATPLRALIYLAASQLPSGGFHQNFWLDGRPYWGGSQLDETAFAILLAWRLHKLGALAEFDPYALVLKAAGYLIREGPVTPQERWEECSGYSPSTLAANIAALCCAAAFVRKRGDDVSADYLQDYADFLESHLEAWTVTTQGSLVPGIPRHYIRIHPVAVDDPRPNEDPNQSVLRIANRGPDEQAEFPARDVIDAGFLELVRYGIRKPGDALIEDSLKVVDAVLKVDTEFGPCWRRYNHDGYGQRADGGPFMGWGQGRPWPLLTGERGHYELAAGRPVQPYIRAMEGFAHGVGLLPEQISDGPDLPDQHMHFGRASGSAMPLVWAHGEYIMLLRSAQDGQVFDLIPEVAEHYGRRQEGRPLEIWKFNRQPQTVRPGTLLRIQAPAAFTLRWTTEEWHSSQDTRSVATVLGIEYVDLAVGQEQRAPVRFTFQWADEERWEGTDFAVEVSGTTD